MPGTRLPVQSQARAHPPRNHRCWAAGDPAHPPCASSYTEESNPDPELQEVSATTPKLIPKQTTDSNVAPTPSNIRGPPAKRPSQSAAPSCGVVLSLTSMRCASLDRTAVAAAGLADMIRTIAVGACATQPRRQNCQLAAAGQHGRPQPTGRLYSAAFKQKLGHQRSAGLQGWTGRKGRPERVVVMTCVQPDEATPEKRDKLKRLPFGTVNRTGGGKNTV